MVSYVGLIRGLNVGGKNKVAMSDLKEQFETLGFESVKTIGNTGVIFFDSEDKVDDKKLGESLTKCPDIVIKIVTLTSEEIHEIKTELPLWWNENKEWRHNALFILDDFDTSEVIEKLSSLNHEIERGIEIHGIIFWSSSFKERKDYYKTEYAKLIKNKVYSHVTIRNGNTFEKICQYMEK